MAIDTMERPQTSGRQEDPEQPVHSIPLSNTLMERWAPHSIKAPEQVATGLGWFSIGLGLAELLAPAAVGQFIGVRKRKWLLRSLGVREIVSGVGILSTGQSTRGHWVWSRVAGDAMDLALLGNAYRSRKSHKGKLTMAALAVLGVTLLDYLTASDLTQKRAKK
jgi:hypothetical protein